MVSDKAYKEIVKTVNNVVGCLVSNNINHEVLGDKHTFAYAPTCTIHTDACTIEINKDRLTVNEKPVANINDLIEIVLQFEQSA